MRDATLGAQKYTAAIGMSNGDDRAIPKVATATATENTAMVTVGITVVAEPIFL